MSATKAGAIVAPAVKTPHEMLVEGLLKGIEDGQFAVPEMRQMKTALQRKLNMTHKTNMIMAGATLTPGDRVMINDSYMYSSMHGVTGTVKEVNEHSSGKNHWCSVRFEADHLPKRRPKYVLDSDGLVYVGGDSVDLIPPAGSGHA